MPSSIARISTRLAPGRSSGSPHTPGPHRAHGAEPEAIHGRVATEGEAATRTIRPQPVRILSGHFAFLFRADSAHIEALTSSLHLRLLPNPCAALSDTMCRL